MGMKALEMLPMLVDTNHTFWMLGSCWRTDWMSAATSLSRPADAWYLDEHSSPLSLRQSTSNKAMRSSAKWRRARTRKLPGKRNAVIR